MKKLSLVLLLAISVTLSFAQGLTMPADGGNKKAVVGESIGITDITIHYNRPGVKGREGRIWGDLVPYGFTDQQFGTSKLAPWRAGANENTTITFGTDVLVEGKPIVAGTYGLFIAVSENDATIIFSKNFTSWGSFFYDEKEDVLRVNVKPKKLNASVEWLTYSFVQQKENGVVVSMQWEKLEIPFTVSVDYIKTQLESIRKELRTDIGFRWDAWVEAVNFCLVHNVNLEEALHWSDYAINAVFVGQRNFRTLNAKAGVLRKLNRTAESEALMKEAMPLANMQELHNYGKQLIREKRAAEALIAFKLNAQKNPGVFTTNMGLARGYSATGDYKNALKYAKLALPQAPDKQNVDAINNYIIMLGEGKDIN
ncbi:DUF2911 domain-containing protein [Ferruginibacter sp. HRS2-29]|uniref:DUF2911 domain-containing protein n=1 Tax=Ferruginibacter sp. HRS2-29 TaxID=2487334 RepID=UPI0020CF5FDB|nr:DUF2911 domain-containing protein [Ferruginibacter sp. HRS2-29]MCP9753280.1 DUF2911 domain-containing protein [Ferruginibacter sp. HRS2-29]